MRNIIRSLAFIATALLVAGSPSAGAQQQAAATPASNVFKVEIEVGRGDRVETAKMSLIPGKPARFSYDYTDGSAPSLRIQVLATRGVAKSKSSTPTVRLQFMLLEKASDAWVLIGEPEISAFEGKPATMQYQSDAGPVALKVFVVSAYSSKAAKQAPATCPGLYSVDAPRPALDVGAQAPNSRVSPMLWPPTENCPQLPCPGPSSPGCCSMYCEKPNTTMTCCGADECCGMGCGCCTPGLG